MTARKQMFALLLGLTLFQAGFATKQTGEDFLDLLETSTCGFTKFDSSKSYGDGDDQVYNYCATYGQGGYKGEEISISAKCKAAFCSGGGNDALQGSCGVQCPVVWSKAFSGDEYCQNGYYGKLYEGCDSIGDAACQKKYGDAGVHAWPIDDDDWGSKNPKREHTQAACQRYCRADKKCKGFSFKKKSTTQLADCSLYSKTCVVATSAIGLNLGYISYNKNFKYKPAVTWQAQPMSNLPQMYILQDNEDDMNELTYSSLATAQSNCAKYSACSGVYTGTSWGAANKYKLRCAKPSASTATAPYCSYTKSGRDSSTVYTVRAPGAAHRHHNHHRHHRHRRRSYDDDR